MEYRTFICSLVLVAVLHTVHSQYKPPEITKPTTPSTEILFSKGNVTLKCKATATPEVKYRWTFNGGRISNTKIMMVNDTTGDLHIDSFTSREVGNYQCYAANEITPRKKAITMSAVITLKEVEFEGGWSSSTQAIERKAGEYVKLTCDNPPPSIPEAQFSWHLVEKKNTEGDVKEDDRKYIDNKGSLHFSYLLKSDQKPNLLYTCGLYNSRRDSIRLGSAKNLVVKEIEGDLPQLGAKVQFYTKDTFLRTKDAELECVFSGNPIPTITWKNKEGKYISTNNNDKYDIKSFGRKLKVKNLNETDEGMYKCIGSNTVGTDEKSIFLDVTSGPIWVESLSSQTITEGKDAVFKCKARNAVGDKNPISDPIWYKNGGPVPTSGKYVFSYHSTVLTVKNVNKATDITCFQCNVSNHIGYEFADGCLNIIDPIVIDVQPLLEQHVAKGDIIILTVIGHTDPAYTLQYRWIFNGKRYEQGGNPPFIIFNEITMQAYIDTSTLSDSEYRRINGTYYRELFHIHDSRTVSIDVTLKELSGKTTSSILPAENVQDRHAFFLALGIGIGIGVAITVVIVGIFLLVKRKGTSLKGPGKASPSDVISANQSQPQARPASVAQDEDDGYEMPIMNYDNLHTSVDTASSYERLPVYETI